jgi:type I restriction enzyme S subunit
MAEFHIQRSLAIFRVQPDSITNESLANIFCSTNFQSLLWENVGFSAQPGIYLGALENFQLPVPPLEEQNEINEYCKTKAERIDILILKAESAIELIQERRTALISAAVTGKIDVRNWLTPEPLLSNTLSDKEASA